MRHRHRGWCRTGWALAVLAATHGIAAQSVATDVSRSRTDVLAMNTILSRTIRIDLTNASLQNAIDAIAASAKVEVQYRLRDVAMSVKQVTLHAQAITLGDAFRSALDGTGLQLQPLPGNHIAIVAVGGTMADVAAEGSITGRVIDAKTKQPLSGVTVLLDDAVRGPQTDEHGEFRLLHVATGRHQIVVGLIGHGKRVKAVTVTDGETASAEFELDASVALLGQVVVTGTVIPTELKAVPNAITVITAKDLEQRGITHIDQLFRGDVPGLFALSTGSYSSSLLGEVSMYSRGVTAFTDVSAGVNGDFLSSPIKTYVDGVELANPTYLSQLDPKSIERIEILTGPQASTIYGSNAINGVMQIFTRRGTTSTPQLTLNLLSGWVENNFSSARTPQHDYSTQLNGVEGRLSYNAGGSWNYMGPWTPTKQTARRNASAGVRLEVPTALGRTTADVTFLREFTQTRQRGNEQQLVTAFVADGWFLNYGSGGATGLSAPTTYGLNSQTLGLTVKYVPLSWWNHEFTVGTDVSDTETRGTGREYQSPRDSSLYMAQTHYEKRSLRYATTLFMPLVSIMQGTVTLGADSWQSTTSSWDVLTQALTGTLTSASVYTDVSRQPDHNTGGFLQTQISVRDALFMTYGLRAEWNPSFGVDAVPNYTPRYGIAYTQAMGALTAKLRGSYGHSTRPPKPGLKRAIPYTSPRDQLYYGNIDFFKANPDLGPEYQRGGEGGIELYLGARASLVITRYNQTVDHLITAVKVDSARSLTPCAVTNQCFFNNSDSAGYGYRGQRQYLNLASIRNQGWELQGTMNVGPLTTRGTYSWAKSRVIGVTPKYQALFASDSRYQAGATFGYLPEHTWAGGVTYARGGSTIALNVTATGQAMILRNSFFMRNLNSAIRLSQNTERMNVDTYLFGGDYPAFNNGYALADLNASQRLSTRVEGVLQIQNLTDKYANDYQALYASLGRQVKAGLRIR